MSRRGPDRNGGVEDGPTVTVINAHPSSRLQHQPFIEAVSNVLDFAGVDRGEVRVIFVDEKELLRLNRDFLGHDYHTDVITFPLEPDPLEGEIYISVEMTRTQAGEEGVSFYDEARRLAIHGTLHLVGYDDGTTEERAEMRKLEDQFLEIGNRPGSPLAGI